MRTTKHKLKLLSTVNSIGSTSTAMIICYFGLLRSMLCPPYSHCLSIYLYLFRFHLLSLRPFVFPLYRIVTKIKTSKVSKLGITVRDMPSQMLECDKRTEIYRKINMNYLTAKYKLIIIKCKPQWGKGI